MQDATDHKINLVLCKDLSRLGRDYIEAGKYTDFVFPSLGCRFIALNDGVDTLRKNNEMLVILKNVMNDLYARDTSKKIKSVFKAKGMSGKHLTGTVLYGYIWDESRTHWLVDEEAAEVVRRIFALTMAGYGPYQISQILQQQGFFHDRQYLEEARILRAYYQFQNPQAFQGQEKPLCSRERVDDL